MAKRYVIELLPEERVELEAMWNRGRASVRRLKRARALLLSDRSESGPGWTDAAIAEALGLTTRTIELLRQRAVEEGPLKTVEGRKCPPRPEACKFDGEREARLVALACSKPPEGRQRWSLRLLADRLVELKVFESISHETVRQVMEKKRSQAVAPRAVVHSARAERPVRLRDGERAGRLPAAV